MGFVVGVTDDSGPLTGGIIIKAVEETVKYMMLVCGDESIELPRGGARIGPSDGGVGEEMDGRGVRLQGEQLRPVGDATTVRVRGGEVLVADGPFAETKEQIAGFDILECADLDEAIEIASKHPVATFGTTRGAAVLDRVSQDTARGGRRGLPRGVGPDRGRADPDDRRLGPGRGVRAGRVRAGADDLAARRRAAAARAPG